ncbi:YcxB family protein [Dyella sp. 2HG41-7]|uniref:YcxB family protein n=1 Tax=Dyella sp. 2HG41-7 TaxID=2883239 RepID=UPI001F28B3CA|nr:YcxB family protein [Dyella sp. 2HG41-7]
MDTNDTTYSLRYSSSRIEVWRWYWRAWRSKYGWWHLLIAAGITWDTLDSQGGAFHLSTFLLRYVWILPTVVVVMAAWPQIAFKSQERLLDVGPEGWSTRIGKKSGSRTWRMVGSIRSNDEVICIVSTTGNALLIPKRAFQSGLSREAFLTDIRRWHGSAAG